MKAERIELLEVDGGELLLRAVGIELVEGIARPGQAAVEKVARIGGLAVIGDLGRSAVQGKIGSWRGSLAIDENVASGGEAIEDEDIGLCDRGLRIGGAIRHPPH